MHLLPEDCAPPDLGLGLGNRGKTAHTVRVAAWQETVTAAVDDFDRPDLHLRLTPDALLAAGLLLEELADENIAALGQL